MTSLDRRVPLPMLGRTHGSRSAVTCHLKCAVQHPGEEGKWEAQNSFFPDYVEAIHTVPAGAWRGPRPSIVQIWRT